MEELKAYLVDYIDAVVYINLAKRTDRNEHMKKVTNIFGSKVQRFEAIEHESGRVGCSKSHVEVMKIAIASDWKNVLVLEDDAEWNHTLRGYKEFKSISQGIFDVILLGSSYPTNITHNSKTSSSTGTHAYLVNRPYFSKLLMNFEEGASLLEQDAPTFRNDYTVDRYWWKLMEIDNWHLIAPNLMYQIDSYSDIAKFSTNYFHIPESVFCLRDFSVKRAYWGRYDSVIDVTDTVQKLDIRKGMFLRHTLFPQDPAQYNPKILMIEYEDGRVQLLREDDAFVIG